MFIKKTKRNQDFCTDLFSGGENDGNILHCKYKFWIKIYEVLVLALLSDTFYPTFGQLEKLGISKFLNILNFFKTCNLIIF